MNWEDIDQILGNANSEQLDAIGEYFEVARKSSV